MPSSKSPSDKSWYSAMAFKTFTNRFSMRTPVWIRSIVTIISMYQKVQAMSSSSLIHVRGRLARALRLETAFKETRRFHALRPRSERVGGTLPSQRIHIAEQRGVAPEGCKVFEEQCELAPASEQRRRKFFDHPVPVQKLRRRDRPDAGDAGISICGVADEREKIGNQAG